MPKAPEEYREMCFASVTVHDLPPTAGMWAGEHVRIREELELLTRDPKLEWADWAREQAHWLQSLRQRGFLASEGEPTTQDVVEALHRYLANTPAQVLAISLPDIVGDVRAQNVPGTFREYPNWCVPTCDADGHAVTIEDLTERPDLAQRTDRLMAALSYRE
jgi:4-alpha-glucanotransferase